MLTALVVAIFAVNLFALGRLEQTRATAVAEGAMAGACLAFVISLNTGLL